MSGDWRDGLRILEARVAALPDVVRAAAAAPVPGPPFDPRSLPRVVTTGIGSSAAHARFLAHLLAHPLGLDARFVPVTGLEPAADDALVVFSQGLSPNGRLPLGRARDWRHVVVATATTAGERLDEVRAAGATLLPFAGADEYGTLVRITGPLAGYIAAYRWAAELGRVLGRPLPPLDAERAAERVARAGDLLDAALPDGDLAGLAFVTSGAYGELVGNLQYKVLEGMLRPLPPVWDVLDLAHGPLQQAFDAPTTWIALARADAAGEAPLLDAAASMLAAGRHRLVRLVATLPGPLAILEHEAALDVLVLRDLHARRGDQVRWPGRGYEEPVYGLARAPGERALAGFTWGEVEAVLARGCRTAVLPLGATEQHGPHLPLATDTWIGEALAERVCARLEDAVALPTLAVGCSPEHMAFPGTLTLQAPTLAAVVGDVLASLRSHGFARAFVFSAHGGNCAPLAAALPALQAAAVPLEVIAFTDVVGVTAALQRVAVAEGVAADAAGHHAGEVETSIMLALRPHAVRVGDLAPGVAAADADAQALFYPSLRAHAPSGTVGDPRPADAARGSRYLAAWADLLVAAYGAAKKRT